MIQGRIEIYVEGSTLKEMETQAFERLDVVAGVGRYHSVYFDIDEEIDTVTDGSGAVIVKSVRYSARVTAKLK